MSIYAITQNGTPLAYLNDTSSDSALDSYALGQYGQTSFSALEESGDIINNFCPLTAFKICELNSTEISAVIFAPVGIYEDNAETLRDNIMNSIVDNFTDLNVIVILSKSDRIRVQLFDINGSFSCDALETELRYIAREGYTRMQQRFNMIDGGKLSAFAN